MSEILKDKPVRKFLKERETLLPRPKLVDLLEGQLTGQIELPPGVAPEQAIEVVARSDWARRLAEGELLNVVPSLRARIRGLRSGNI